MRLLGKAFELEKSLLKFESELKSRDIEVELTNPMHPVEHLWSIHLRSKIFPNCFTNGKGTTKQAAIASALGEFFERFSQLYFFSNYYIGKNDRGFHYFPQEVAVDARKVDPIWIRYYLDGERDDDAFFDIGSGSDDVICLPFIDLISGKEKLVPFNILTNLFGSNGMAAGNTREEALVQSLSEIIERHVKFRIISENISLPEVPLEVLQQYPVALAAVQSLQQFGLTIFVQDASLGGAYPVINVTLVDPKTGSVFASFGSHPKFQVALERTLTELCQGRKIEDFSRFPAPSWSQHLVSDPNNLEEHFIDSDGLVHWDLLLQPSNYEFVHWNCQGTIEDELEFMTSIFEESEQSVLVFESSHLGIPTVRVIVPEMSEVYPIEDMLLNNCNRSRFLQRPLMELDKLESQEIEELLERIEELEAEPVSLIAPMIGLIPDPQSGWDTLTLVQLRALMCLAVGDSLRMQETLELWQMAAPVPRLYDLLLILLRHAENEDEILPPLELFFTADLLCEAQSIMENPFSSLPALGEDFSNCHLHQRMISLLRQSQNWMQEG